MAEKKPNKRYRGRHKFYHQTPLSRVDAILKNGLLLKHAICSDVLITTESVSEGGLTEYTYEYKLAIFLNAGEPFYTPEVQPYFVEKMVVFEVDVRGIRDYVLRWGTMRVFEDIPPDRLKLIDYKY